MKDILQQQVQPAVAIEVDEKNGRPVPGTLRKEADAITTPQEMQMASETAEEEEDQAMALWLSDPEDDENVADNGDRGGIQIGNAPVERERSLQRGSRR